MNELDIHQGHWTQTSTIHTHTYMEGLTTAKSYRTKRSEKKRKKRGRREDWTRKIEQLIHYYLSH